VTEPFFTGKNQRKYHCLLIHCTVFSAVLPFRQVMGGLGKFGADLELSTFFDFGQVIGYNELDSGSVGG